MFHLQLGGELPSQPVTVILNSRTKRRWRGGGVRGVTLQIPASTGPQNPSSVAVIISACVITDTNRSSHSQSVSEVHVGKRDVEEETDMTDWINYYEVLKGRFSMGGGVCVRSADAHCKGCPAVVAVTSQLHT